MDTMTNDPPLPCDDCGGPVDATDGLTDGSFVWCGGVYGNGCDAKHLDDRGRFVYDR